MEHATHGWDIWQATGPPAAPVAPGAAATTVLGGADGFEVRLVWAGEGHAGDPHVHGFPEFLYVLDGTVRVQGRTLRAGDGYAAATGSSHTELATDTGATYLVVARP